ncbi:Hypothetical predicted protein [Olea europaea subsp. europaea]|uniref:Uncharacterized protein n=1 Tax=Olea europaea subsp. europaea TaxID=158383 RepID=A0A8S0PLF8_OLEEU|nr:Hypothetical predicted protein [Olea europaea subsp. europaea]
MNDLHVSITVGLHQSFLWLRPAQEARKPTPRVHRCRGTSRAYIVSHNRGNGIPQGSIAQALAASSIHAGPRPESIEGSARHHSAFDWDVSSTPIRFPPDNFKHFFNSFFKVLFIFSSRYLALDGIYRSIGAAFLNDLTHRQCFVLRQGSSTTGLSSSLAPLPRGLELGPPSMTLL